MTNILFLFSLSLLFYLSLCGTPRPIASPINTKASIEELKSYWTPDRMKNAISRDIIIENNASFVNSFMPSDGVPVRIEGRLPLIYQNASELYDTTFMKKWTSGNIDAGLTRYYPYCTQGKVFFSINGGDYVCSGAVGGHKLVFTAGHCVFDRGSKSWVSKWIFVPGYSNNNRPFGDFWAYQLWASTGFTDNSPNSPAFDYAMVVMYPNNGWIGDVVGWQGSVYNGGYDRHWRSFGYPAAAPWYGQIQHWCDSNLEQRGSDLSPNTIGIGCDSTGGASGGPYLLDFSTTSGSYINSVNSYGVSNQPNRMYGPYFDTNTLNMFDAANKVSP